jgi:CheY-like chemotaxis protein
MISRALAPFCDQIICIADGIECLDVIQKEIPDIVFLGIKLPRMHGISILKAIRANPQTHHIAVVICTSKALIQDYQQSVSEGANYYLAKPFDISAIPQLIEKYYTKQLFPDPFKVPQYAEVSASQYYVTPSENNRPYIQLWGVRGSIPVSGAQYQRFGGSTSCLELHTGNETVIIDAGTGIQSLGTALLKSPHRHIHLFIGHTHWDHIIGFPFFAPAYHKDFTIDIYAAPGFNRGIQQLFKGMLSYDYFPVRLDEMQATLRFHELDGNPICLGDKKVHYIYANHPGSTLSFKIESKDAMIGYVTDNEMFVGYHGHPNLITNNHLLLKSYQAFIDFYKGCTTLIHEAQYTPEEYRAKVGWGHSSINNAAILVRECAPENWIFTHHDPIHTDAVLLTKLQAHQLILEECGIKIPARAAYEGLKILL